MNHNNSIKSGSILTLACFLFVYAETGKSNERQGNVIDILSEVTGSAMIHSDKTNPDHTIQRTIPLEYVPYWSSQTYGTLMDVALIDINNDGYPEVITSYDEDHNYLYPNNQGTLNNTPSWQSNDSAHNSWLAFGDYDNDGDLDMAVAAPVTLGGRTRLYQNNNGTLTTDPFWTATVDGGLVCDWGDADNDGDLDLAITEGLRNPAVFYNHNGSLESIPSWHGLDYNMDFGVAWIDVDSDGDLDLAVGGLNMFAPSLRIYYNNNDSLESIASWKSQDNAEIVKGMGLSVWDINQDGWLDVSVASSDNNAIFMNLHDSLEAYPSWFSNDANESAGCLFGDINGDGYLDWVVHNGGRGVVYENTDTSLNPNYAWQSVTPFLGSGMYVDIGDVDNDGIVYREDTIVSDGTKKLFYLSVIPIHKLEEITIDDIPVSISEYCYNLKSGWVSFKNAFSPGNQIIVKYYHSVDMEVLLAGTASAFLYRNTNNVGVADQDVQPLAMGLRIYPNPVVAGLPIKLVSTLKYPALVEIDLYDCIGRHITTLYKQRTNPGLFKTEIPTHYPAGTYFLKLKCDDNSIFTKIVIIKQN